MTRRFDPADIPPSPNLSFEQPLWAAGTVHVAGLDEAGRGAWAGPVTAGAVILPYDDAHLIEHLSGVRDSKQMTPKERSAWAECIHQFAAAWAVGWASSLEIDTIGIVPATRLAMQRALAGLLLAPQHLLIDALRLPAVSLPQLSLIKGDGRSLSIAAASVLAKTARDACMEELDGLHPGYGFARHKGYGTQQHQHALLQQGSCCEHRRSYAPIKLLFSEQQPSLDMPLSRD